MEKNDHIVNLNNLVQANLSDKNMTESEKKIQN